MIKEGVFLGKRYEILGRIGSGGMADVYKGKDHKLNRFVAIKVLKSDYRSDETFIKKFLSEAQAAAGLMHPNVVNVYDVGQDRGLYYMVMELVEGITLKDYIEKKGKLSAKETISIAIQMVTGIQAAHNCHIIHRDIKPQNIIISKEGKVKVTDFGDERKKPEGRIKEILGHVNDPGTDILSLVRAYNLPEVFPEEVMKELEHVPDSLPTEGLKDLPEGFEGRKDLRDLQTVTIDGEDAKDLDDAVTLELLENGNYRLGVHIADVSHYVKEGSELDKEALKRSTSVYLVDRVIPMLPHKLSNGICSLNQGTDRLAMSCLMEVDPHGTVVDHEICESVIRSDRRMTYTAVNAILSEADTKEKEEQKAGLLEEYKDFVAMFERMKELSAILREKRSKRGAIDFDFPESKIILDEKGKPVDIHPYERNVATKIIEDFMLLANETVAEDYFWQSVPFLYRTHDDPDPEKMKQLGVFINNFGYSLRLTNGEVHPKELQKLLDKIEGKPEEPLLARLVLRSMKQAKYTTQCTGHFGLAARYYTHFTSPIRRYPDLQIHRIIKECLRGGLKEKRVAHYEKLLPQVAVQTSALERRADEAERETEKMKKCEYMSRFVGQTFEGVISGVTNWGFYVELPNTVEGLVRISELRDDYYIFDESRYELVGEMSRKVYKLGQTVRVVVAGTDKLLRTVDFVLENQAV